MSIKKAEFVKSSAIFSECPQGKIPEYAFIGRSNVGKSSLINMLTERKSLAKVSSRPGKTQLINHFLIDETWFLVDLPGYGWAKASKTSREKWQKMIREYLTKRKNLVCTFLLIDSRLDPQPIDLEFLNWLGGNEVPLALIFTKADKLGLNKSFKNQEKFNENIRATWETPPVQFISSSEKAIGREEVLNFIKKTNQSIGF